MPRFSVVVPAYNAEATLGETLDAVSGQGFEDWECIIVDDGSVDGTSAVGDSFTQRDARFRLIAQANQGTAGAYNTGVNNAQSGLIAICSSDDLLLPDHLSAMDELVSRYPEHGLFSSNGEYIYDSCARTRVYDSADWTSERSLSFEEVLACCFYSVGAVYRRSVFDLVDGYRTGVYGEDYDFWLRAMARGVRHRYTPEVLSHHRVSAAQKSSDLLRVYESNIEVFSHLIDADWVVPSQVPLVESAIESRRILVEECKRNLKTQATSRKLKSVLRSVLGNRAGERSIGVISSALHRIRAWRNSLWK